MVHNDKKSASQYMIRQKAEALKTWIDGFIRDCCVRDLSPFTIEYYRSQLAAFEKFCNVNHGAQITDITPDVN
jgi:hypothetical protein